MEVQDLGRDSHQVVARRDSTRGLDKVPYPEPVGSPAGGHGRLPSGPACRRRLFGIDRVGFADRGLTWVNGDSVSGRSRPAGRGGRAGLDRPEIRGGKPLVRRKPRCPSAPLAFRASGPFCRGHPVQKRGRRISTDGTVIRLPPTATARVASTSVRPIASRSFMRPAKHRYEYQVTTARPPAFAG